MPKVILSTTVVGFSFAVFFSAVSSAAVVEHLPAELKNSQSSAIIVNSIKQVDELEFAQKAETDEEKAERKRAERERKRAERAAKRKKRTTRPRFGSFF